jgi:hypothetical protein
MVPLFEMILRLLEGIDPVLHEKGEEKQGDPPDPSREEPGHAQVFGGRLDEIVYVSVHGAGPLALI